MLVSETLVSATNLGLLEAEFEHERQICARERGRREQVEGVERGCDPAERHIAPAGGVVFMCDGREVVAGPDGAVSKVDEVLYCASDVFVEDGRKDVVDALKRDRGTKSVGIDGIPMSVLKGHKMSRNSWVP